MRIFVLKLGQSRQTGMVWPPNLNPSKEDRPPVCPWGASENLQSGFLRQSKRLSL